MIRFVLFAAAMTVAVAGSLHAADFGILTLSGKIEKSNRGPTSAGHATLLGSQDITFDRGFTMSTADLAALPQVEREATPPGEKTLVKFSGPRAADVLEAVGATGETAVVTALDGYASEIPIDLIKQHDPILAVSRDGATMAIGDQGPLVMVWPSTEDPELAEKFKRWKVWGVYYIGVD